MIRWNLLSTKIKIKLMLYCSLLIISVFLILFLVYFLVIVKSSEITDTVVLIEIDSDTKVKFEKYMKKFGKVYKDDNEYQRRFLNFKNSLKETELLNGPKWRSASDDGYELFGQSKYSDMSPEEFADQMLMKGVQPVCKEKYKLCPNRDWGGDKKNVNGDIARNNYPPRKLDWRKRGAVGPVLEQKRCLNCWAFGVVGVMESMLKIKNLTKVFKRLSVQELTDCSNYTNKCHRGSSVEALNFLCNTHWPIISENEYPLTTREENCMISQPKEGVLVTQYHVRCNMSSREIVKQLTIGPVVATVSATQWQYYLGGVIKYHCSDNWTDANHVVQIIGYDLSAPTPYFTLRNSWGTDFGDNGYVHVAMDSFLCDVGRQIAFCDVDLNK